MYQLIIVGIGGFIGAVLRYVISILSIKVFGNTFPYGTLIVNITGCFVIGLILSSTTNQLNVNTKLLVITGLLGALTTFSTFSYETLNYFNHNQYNLGILNAALNFILCFSSVLLGKYISNII